MLIRKGSNEQLTNNFTEKEIFNASYGGVDSFTISDKVLLGAQIIRDFYGVPMGVNSSHRTVAHELAQGRSGNSQHTKSALDLRFLEDNEKYLLLYHQDILSQGPLYKKLRAAGITGFGLYDTFLHIDPRTERMSESDEFGKLETWDNRVTTKKKFQV